MYGAKQPAQDGGAEKTGRSRNVRSPGRRDGLAIVFWLNGILAVLVAVLGVYAFEPKLSVAVPALAPLLATYAEVVGTVLARIAEAVVAVASLFDTWVATE